MKRKIKTKKETDEKTFQSFTKQKFLKTKKKKKKKKKETGRKFRIKCF